MGFEPIARPSVSDAPETITFASKWIVLEIADLLDR
jgi:hypothetical protein